MSLPIPLSPNKSTLTGWLKNLKKTDSNETNKSNSNSELSSSPQKPSINLNLSLNSITNSHSHSNSNSNSISNSNSNLIPIPLTSPRSLTPISVSNKQLSTSPTPSRPFLGFKSRSSHSFRPLSSYVDSNNNNNNNSGNEISLNNPEKFRNHRDSFLQQRQLDNIGNSAVFGCDLKDSVNIATGTIYISDNNDGSGLVVYGRIPLVVASCGLFLKTNALNTEGIFRVAGSTKRIKQLQLIFSNPPDYGSKINWDGFTVHDTASLLRRYLSALPEPLIPFQLYESFRNPLRSRTNILKYLKDKEKKMSNSTNITNDSNTSNLTSPESQASSIENANSSLSTKKSLKKERKQIIIKERKEALKDYAELFDKLPTLERQLLFYILDLLSIFNLHSDKNLMPAKNLAAVFQPSILSHPDHDMSPDEYALSSLVIEFMIQYSHKILPAAQESVKNAAVKDNKEHELLKKSDKNNKTQTTNSNINATASNATTSANSDVNSQVLNRNQLLSPSYPTRKHSKSLSHVQNNSDMLRLLAPKPDSNSKSKHNPSNSDDIDSAMDTEDDEPYNKYLSNSVLTLSSGSFKSPKRNPNDNSPINLDNPPLVLNSPKFYNSANQINSLIMEESIIPNIKYDSPPITPIFENSVNNHPLTPNENQIITPPKSDSKHNQQEAHSVMDMLDGKNREKTKAPIINILSDEETKQEAKEDAEEKAKEEAEEAEEEAEEVAEIEEAEEDEEKENAHDKEIEENGQDDFINDTVLELHNMESCEELDNNDAETADERSKIYKNVSGFTANGESSSSLAFSIQPSLVNGHISNEEFESPVIIKESTDQTEPSIIEPKTPVKLTSDGGDLTTLLSEISTTSIQSNKNLKLSTSGSNDNNRNIDNKNSGNGNGKSNIDVNGNISGTQSPIKDKKSWFSKLRPRSNSKK